MQQLEIQYFFPLTEQIPLDLDYRPSHEYEAKKKADMIANSVFISNGGIAYTFSGNIEPYFQIDIDQTPITVVSKNKPNIIKQYLYNMLGIKWKVK